MKRNRVLSIALAGVVASGAVGWVAGTQVQSSNEAAAAAEPPEASAVTAAVKKLALSADVVTRGRAEYGEPQAVSLPGGSGSVVTRAPEEGGEVAEGAPFMEANGLPVFALQGDRPMYRDLGPGDAGEDVKQLEEALARLGFDPGPADGVYDGATASAIDRWYTAAGYTAEGPSDAERSELRSAENALDQAESQLAAAQRNLADGTEPPTAAELLQAESDVQKAADALATAKVKSVDDQRAAEKNVTTKYEAVQAAKDKAIEDEKQARRDVDAKYAAAEIARANLQAARAGGPDGPSQAGVLQAQQAVTQAEQALADARAARDAQPDKSAQAIVDAEGALDDARAALPRAKTDGEAAIRNAETALSLAQMRLADVKSPKTNASLTAAVSDAAESVTEARENLDEVQTGIGAKIRSNSLVFFGSLPLRIDSVDVERGDPASGAVMTVSGSRLIVRTSVTLADAKLLSEGMAVKLEAPDLGVTIEGKVAKVAEKPGTNGADNQHISIEIEPIEPPANFRDADVKVTIPVKATAGEVLVVPVAAVSSGADGSARVETVDGAGARHEVKVKVGLSASGLVEVSAVEGELSEGDRVVVGTQ